MSVACAGGGGSAPLPAATPTLTPPPTATPVDLGVPRPERDRVMEHIRVLSEEIGSRVAGSPEESEAAAYAQEQFEQWGYDVGIQSFQAAAPDNLRYATLTVTEPEERELLAAAFGGSPPGDVTGTLVDAGAGEAGEFPPEAAGAVVLIQRRDVLFVDMARRAQEVGAVGAIAVNRETGLFPGKIDPPTELPFVGIDQADGEALRELLAQGSVEVRIDVREEVTSQNVVARPESGECRTVSGGHYDSVPWAPGSNDNASGSGVVLELARAAASGGLSGHCFVLFGAEEAGLLGSAFFVSQMSEAEREGLAAYLNFDVVGSDPRPLLAVSDELFDGIEALVERDGYDVELGSQPWEYPSDHRSFLNAGIPVLVLTTPGYESIHTPEDTLANVVPDSVEAVARFGFALLQEVGGGF